MKKTLSFCVWGGKNIRYKIKIRGVIFRHIFIKSKKIQYYYFQAFVGTGFNLIMNFDTSTNFNPAHRQCDFDREPGKVSIV